MEPAKMEDEQPDQFTSVYRHDYIPLERGMQLPSCKENHITHTVRETDEFLNICDDSPPPPPASFDLANEYLENTFKKEHPKLYNIYFKDPLNKYTIDMELLKDSVYHKDYCRLAKGPVKDQFDIAIDRSDAIETTMRDHYRNPQKFGVLSHNIVAPPMSILSKNQRVVTAIAKCESKSEYQDLIGTTGQFIIDNEIYGKMTYPE